MEDYYQKRQIDDSERVDIQALKDENKKLKDTLKKREKEDKDITDIKHDLLSLKNIIRMALIGLVILAFNAWLSDLISKYIPERTTTRSKFVYFLCLFIIVVAILGLTVQGTDMITSI